MSGDLLTFGFALVKKESQVDANETRGKAMAGKLTKQEKSWILYDVGNSAFVLLATALIPVYFKTLAEPGSSVVVAWGYAETVASLLLALLMRYSLMPPPMSVTTRCRRRVTPGAISARACRSSCA